MWEKGLRIERGGRDLEPGGVQGKIGVWGVQGGVEVRACALNPKPYFWVGSKSPRVNGLGVQGLGSQGPSCGSGLRIYLDLERMQDNCSLES